MKTLYMCFIASCMMSVSCSFLGGGKKSSSGVDLMTRNPDSLSDGTQVVLNSDMLNRQVSGKSFYDFIKEAQQSRINKVLISPQENGFVKTGQESDENTVGDFFVLIGTNFSTNDETIRKADYDVIYETIKRMSWLRFKVTVNLVATVHDLKSAFKNERPAIVLWTSHGNEEGFYDFNQVKVPESVFKNASPMVYQFILTACNGFTALQDVYKKSLPNGLKYWGWTDLVYHPTTVDSFFNNNNGWSPLINFPIPLDRGGYSCRPKKSGDAYELTESGQSKVIDSFSSAEKCAYPLFNAKENYICIKLSNDKVDIYSRKVHRVTKGVSFDNNYDCVARLNQIYNNKLCRRIDDKFHIIDLEDNSVSKQEYDNVNSCYESLQGTFDL